MPEGSKTHMGGTMRLGSRQTNLQSRNCHAFRLYNSLEVHERHRHRYEVNPSMIAELEEAGLQFVGQSVQGLRMQILEVHDGHPYFLAT